MIDRKRIARNTIYMYIRMLIIMIVTLFTSRVILDKLGISDYGLYNAVAGAVGLLSFLNNTLSKGTSRFLTFDLWQQNAARLKQTFSTAFYMHLCLALIIVIILETGGLWFINHQLLIPSERLFAAEWVYQISIFTAVISILQVPYVALIIAHEDMSIYAYISIFEVLGKLFVVYLLIHSPIDRLIYYAVLIACMQLLVALIYLTFCKLKYIESKLKLTFEKSIFKEMLGFSGWNIIANLSETLRVQGANVLINMFFHPALVAAQAIANQVTAALMQFVNSFITALNPQIIKLHATKDFENSRKLTLDSTILVFDLVLLLCLPFFFVIGTIFNLWLVEVPEYAIIFTRYALVFQILGVFSVTFYTPMLASGKLKLNSMAALLICVGQFVILYFLYRAGFSVMFLQYILLISTIVFAFIVKPYILCTEIGYSLKEIIPCYINCGKVFISSTVLSYLASLFLDTSLGQQIILFTLIMLIVLICSFVFMELNMRNQIVGFIKSKLFKH